MLKNKSILFSAPWKVEIIRSDYDLGTPGEDEIIIRNLYSLISAGTELACLSVQETNLGLHYREFQDIIVSAK